MSGRMEQAVLSWESEKQSEQHHFKEILLQSQSSLFTSLFAQKAVHGRATVPPHAMETYLEE